MDWVQFFAKDVKYNYFIEYLHNAQQHLCRGFLFWKHEIFTVAGNLKFENFMIFLELLVLFPYCFLKVKSCVERVFQGFRAIWCRKGILFDDLPSKKQLFLFWSNFFQCLTCLKRIFWFEYQCLEPTYACRSYSFTPNEEHLKSAINNYNLLKYNYCCYYDCIYIYNIKTGWTSFCAITS